MSKFNSELCNKSMSFQECELAILRQAVDDAETTQGKNIATNSEVLRMISILETFLKRKRCICYGGTAINNILPKQAQFYDKDIEIPDYDFYSPNPLDDAKELADIYADEGFLEVEAKAGVHHGTYKVYVNFIAIADITLLHPTLFNSIEKDSIKVNGIMYCPPNFLRMNMFIELSRPNGDVSRWEKVLKRLILLNKHYPLKVEKCQQVEFQRKMENNSNDAEKLYFTIRDKFVDEQVVFLGGYATRLFSRYSPNKENHIVKKIPDFDVIYDDPEKLGLILVEQLHTMGFSKAKAILHEAIDEIIPLHVEIRIGKETMAFIYEPVACHSYNKIKIKDNEIRIATIDTMLNFYLAFYYSDKPYYPRDRILCMANFLFNMEKNNRLEQKGLLKRFSIDCYGHQPTMEEIRSKKLDKFKELKDKRGTLEYDTWFLKYVYSDGKFQGNKNNKNNKTKKKSTKKKKDKNKKSAKALINLF